MADDPRELPDATPSYGDDTVTLLVGPKKEKLLLHRSQMERSWFLQTAFKKAWNGDVNELPLPDEDVNLVRKYVHWLYSGKIASKVPDDDDDDFHSCWHEEETELLAELYVLGEKYQDRAFKNCVIDAMTAKSRTGMGDVGWCPTGRGVDIIYEGTCSRSPARGLMIEMHLRDGGGDWIADTEGNNSTEFLEDLCRRMLDERENSRHLVRTGWTGIAIKENCKYHEHEEGKKCSPA